MGLALEGHPGFWKAGGGTHTQSDIDWQGASSPGREVSGLGIRKRQLALAVSSLPSWGGLGPKSPAWKGQALQGASPLGHSLLAFWLLLEGGTYPTVETLPSSPSLRKGRLPLGEVLEQVRRL